MKYTKLRILLTTGALGTLSLFPLATMSAKSIDNYDPNEAGSNDYVPTTPDEINDYNQIKEVFTTFFSFFKFKEFHKQVIEAYKQVLQNGTDSPSRDLDYARRELNVYKTVTSFDDLIHKILTTLYPRVHSGGAFEYMYYLIDSVLLSSLSTLDLSQEELQNRIFALSTTFYLDPQFSDPESKQLMVRRFNEDKNNFLHFVPSSDLINVNNLTGQNLERVIKILTLWKTDAHKSQSLDYNKVLTPGMFLRLNVKPQSVEIGTDTSDLVNPDKEELTSLKSQYDTLKTQYDTLVNDKKLIEEKLKQLNSSILDKDKSINSLQSNIQELMNQNSNLIANQKSLGEIKTKLETLLNTLIKKLQTTPDSEMNLTRFASELQTLKDNVSSITTSGSQNNQVQINQVLKYLNENYKQYFNEELTPENYQSQLDQLFAKYQNVNSLKWIPYLVLAISIILWIGAITFLIWNTTHKGKKTTK